MAKGRIVFAMFLFLVTVYMVISAFSFKRQAALMPFVIGVPLLILAGINIYQEFKKASKSEKQQNRETELPGKFKNWFKLSNNEFRIWLWYLAFIAAIVFVGLTWAGAVFMFLFLLIEAKQKWVNSLITSVIVTAACYLFFDYTLGIVLYKGILL